VAHPHLDASNLFCGVVPLLIQVDDVVHFNKLWFSLQCTWTSIEIYHDNLSFLFASVKFGFIVLQCRLKSHCLNSLCNVLLFEPRAWAKDLIVDLLLSGIVATCDRSTWTFFRLEFLGFLEPISTGIPVSRHCFARFQIHRTADRWTSNNSATLFVLFLLSLPLTLLSSKASYIYCLWVGVRYFALLRTFAISCPSLLLEPSTSSWLKTMSTSFE
jgi:hypothetical protein